MIDQLVESLLFFLQNVVYLAGQGLMLFSKVIALPGFFSLLISALAARWAWKNTQNVVGALSLFFGSWLVIYFTASFMLFPFLFKGAANSLTSCYKAAGTNAPSLSVCDTLAQGFVWNEGSAGPQTTLPPIIYNHTTPEPENQVVRTFKANALEILTKNWNLSPPDWPRDIPGQLVGPADLPQGFSASFKCDNPIATLKNEKWKVTISGDVPGLGRKTLVLEANGYFATDKDGFNAKSDTSIIGTGSWEDVCPECYTDVVVTPPPQPTPTPAPAAQKVPFPKLICGYWGYIFQGEWQVVRTTGGQPDYSRPVSQASASADINKRCPGETLPAPP